MPKTVIRRAASIAIACAVSMSLHAAADTPRTVDVPAGELTAALKKLAEQSGVEFIYSADQLKGVHTGGVQGEYTAEKAVTRLLEGTKLKLTVRDSGALLISDINARPRSFTPSGYTPRYRLAQANASPPPPASTGSSATNATESSRSASLEEVVVTATRREENIRDVPISISAFSKAQMDVQGMRAIDDIARLAPGVQFGRGGGLGSDLGNSISIRGIASGAGQATTGVYIDDTPVQVGAVIAAGNFTDTAYPQLFDIERVEVLRGPQGTLFGSGSEGGTIRFITPAPSLTAASAYVRSEVSTTKGGAPGYEFGAAGGAPIIDGKLGFRASVWNRRDGGYVDLVNYYTGQVTQEDNNYTDSTSARFALAWQPIEDLTITPSFFFQDTKANGSSSFFLASDGLTGSVTPGGPPLPVFVQPYGNVDSGDYVDLRSQQWGRQRLTLPALKLNYTLGNVELLSNTSYYERKQSGQTDFQFFEAGVFAGLHFPNPIWANNPSIDHQDNRFFTQELRLQSVDKDARLRWVAGAFYSRTRTGFDRTIYAPYLGEMIAAGPVSNGCVPSRCVVERFGQPLAFGQYPLIWYANLQESQKALFGQVDFNITDHIIATAGVRHAKLTNEFNNKNGGAAPGVPFPTFQHVSSDSSATTPKFMLSYKSDNGALVYASATKGFRGGGSNVPLTARAACQESLRLVGLATTPSSYEPDSVWSYELGSKFTTSACLLQVDARVFQIDWSDQIRNLRLTNCTQSFTYNIGEVQSRGFDLAVQWRALDSLLLTLNGGYQEVKATKTIRLGTGTQNAVTKGDKLPGTQPTVNAAAQYTFDLRELPSYLRLDVNYNGKAARDWTFNPANSGYNQYQLFEDPSVTLTNLRLGTHLGDWDVSLFCNNLFNEQPILNKGRSTLTFFGVPSGMLTANTVRPRTAGVTAVLRF